MPRSHRLGQAGSINAAAGEPENAVTAQAGTLTRRSLTAGFCALMLAPFTARAQARRQVQVVVPYPPGGPLDTVARIVAQRLSSQASDIYIVENRAGANGNLGARAVAQARPDGNTWLFGSDALVTVNPALYARQLGYDPERELKVVAAVGSLPSILVVNPRSGPRTLQEFVELGKRGEISYASGGVGSAGHLTMEYLGSVAGLKLQHVPYRGGAPAMTDLVAGQVQAAFVAIGGALDHVRSGALRALAVSSAQRIAAVPDVPTIKESGFSAWAARVRSRR